MRGLAPWGCGVESVGGGNTWTLLLAPWGWVLKLQVVGTQTGSLAPWGCGVESVGGGNI